MSKKRKVAEGGARKLVQPIPLDSSGRPVFPIVLGGLTVYSLGEVSHHLLIIFLHQRLCCLFVRLMAIRVHCYT